MGEEYVLSLTFSSYADEMAQMDVHYSIPRDVDLAKRCERDKNQVRLFLPFVVHDLTSRNRHQYSYLYPTRALL
jgi:hypothetical protein